jgi:hypothetical protein
MADVEGLVAYLQEEHGDDLHGVIGARNDDGVEGTVHYLRPDVEERYEEADLEAMAKELIFGSLESGYLDDIYHLGGHRFSVEYFEYAALLMIALDDDHAIAIGLTATDELNHTAIARECLARL